MANRVEEERQLCDTIPAVQDLQWQLLLQSANPRANHAIRSIPPNQSAEYARAHDEGIWAVAKVLLELEGTEHTQQLASGLRSSHRCAPAAYWASWADALPMISDRNPAVADMVVHTLALGAHGRDADAGCLVELHDAAARFDREGFWWRPSWNDLRHGKRPPVNTSSEPDEWQHGWQFWASSVSDTHFRKRSILSCCTAASRAHLRSHSGRNAGVALAHAPTTPELTVPPFLFRVLLLERGAPLDVLGRHRAACTRTGRLRKGNTHRDDGCQHLPGVGAHVRFNMFLRDMNLGVAAVDERRIEVVAQDLPCFGGAQLAVDVTHRSALRCTGEPKPPAADEDGAVLRKDVP